MMTMATNLFMLIVCIELASLSTYVLVAFKEDGTGGEAGVKYFIGVGRFCYRYLRNVPAYLWSGSSDLEILRQSWLS